MRYPRPDPVVVTQHDRPVKYWIVGPVQPLAEPSRDLTDYGIERMDDETVKRIPGTQCLGIVV